MEIKKFLGLKNTSSAERLKPGHLELAQNVDLDDTGKLLTRLGAVLATGGATHSLWSDGDAALVMRGLDLCRVNPDFSLTVLTRLTSGARLTYQRVQNTIYFSNGVDKGRVWAGGVGEWGVRPPIGQPVARPGAGSLPAGRYRYAMTYVRGDGQESGAGAPGIIELAVPGGIDFTMTDSPSDPEVVFRCIYVSGDDGLEMYRVIRAQTTLTSYLYTGTHFGTVRLETGFVTPPPACTIAEVHSGLMYVVRDNAAYYSDPYNYERFRSTQFLLYPGPITMFASVNDGIYVSTPDGTWFLEGTEPDKLKSRLVFPYGAIPGTAVKTTVGTLKALEEAREGEPGSTAVMWTTAHGVCVGAEGGTALNLTERDYSFPAAQRGAGVVRQVRGYTQYLVALEGSGAAANPYS